MKNKVNLSPHTWKIAFFFAFLALLVDGADLMLLSYSLNSIKAEFQLSSVQAGMLGSFTLAGMAIGGIFGGWACDQFGRVRIVVISILLFSVLTCGLGLTQNFIQFSILRFFASLGLGSLYIACNTLMAEYVPTRYRTTVLGTLQAGRRLDILWQLYLQAGLSRIMVGECYFTLQSCQYLLQY